MRLELLRRAGGVVVGALLASIALLGGAAGAQAADGTDPGDGPLTFGRQVTRYDVEVDLTRDGTAHVAIDMDFSFGNHPGRGPFITIPTRQRYDAELDRRFFVSDVAASSATGAPDRVHVGRGEDGVTIRVGEESRADISGTQQYTIRYTIEGLLNAAAGDGTYDELFWNVIGDAWEVPISNASVTVRGPGEIADVACFAGGRGSKDPCTSHSFAGATATFTEDVLPEGRMFTVLVGWPAGTFPGVLPILERRPAPANPFAPNTAAGAVAGVVLLLGVGIAVTRVRTRGRDEAYLGLTPGVVPAAGQLVSVGPRDESLPIAVQFTPPADVHPGVIGTLVDEVADPHDVTATLVDLAVRGYLRIEEVPRRNPDKPAKNWTLIRLKDTDVSLAPYEKSLFEGIFAGRDLVRLTSLRTKFASTMAQVQRDLYTEVTGRGWFRADPRTVRTRWNATGGFLIAASVFGVIFALALGEPRGIALVPLATLVLGVVLLICAKRAPARTADGTAVLVQALGFKKYLETAEAEQLRWEEGEDIFSRYLPFAIAFGIAERWAKVFEDLAAQGRVVPEPSWYVGHQVAAGAMWTHAGFSTAFDRFTTTATTAISAPAPSSTGGSGGSGFSGGGFSGGGVGGGGGGGW